MTQPHSLISTRFFLFYLGKKKYQHIFYPKLLKCYIVAGVELVAIYSFLGKINVYKCRVLRPSPVHKFHDNIDIIERRSKCITSALSAQVRPLRVFKLLPTRVPHVTYTSAGATPDCCVNIGDPLFLGSKLLNTYCYLKVSCVILPNRLTSR